MRWPSRSVVIGADASPRTRWTTLGSAPAPSRMDAAVCRRSCDRSVGWPIVVVAGGQPIERFHVRLAERAALRRREQPLVGRPLRVPAPVRLWTNFADPFDVVTLDTTLADDFRSTANVITDVPVDNRSPNSHAPCGYLRTREVRATVAAAV